MAMADEGALQAFLQQQNVSGVQLLKQLQKTFKKDYTTDHIKRIWEACDPYQVSGKDSAEDVGKYLSDFEPLTGLVSTSYPPSDMTKYFDLTNQCSRFSTCIGSLLSPPASGYGEEFAINLQKLWELLRLIRGPKQLNYLSTKNMVEKSTNSWKLFIKSKRPDNIILCGGKVMCFGEEKEKSEEFNVALRELTKKVIELPPALYGTLKFLICYAAAGDYIQFFMLKLRKADGAPILTPVTAMLDMKEQTPTVVLYYIKLYFLILGMDASVGRELPYHLNTETKHGYSTITLTLTGAIKRIPDFEAYCDEFGIEFTDLRKAYEAASLSHGHMINSVRGPRREEKEIDVQVTLTEVTASRSAEDSASRSKRSSSTSMSSGRSKKLKVEGKETKKMLKEVYQVQTIPLCGEKEPKCEADLRDMAYGVLQAFKQLHAAGLVHRDIRYANVLYDYSSDKYVLIDLETVCKDGQVAEFELKRWNGRTLDSESRYTTLSDLHQLGVLLEDLEVKDLSDECMEFIDLLKSKSPGTTAESLLQHKWITQKLKGEQSET